MTRDRTEQQKKPVSLTPVHSLPPNADWMRTAMGCAASMPRVNTSTPRMNGTADFPYPLWFIQTPHENGHGAQPVRKEKLEWRTGYFIWPTACHPATYRR